MDIQTRKIIFVKEFLDLKSENTISLLEKVMQSESLPHKPFTVLEYQERIKKSLADSENGNVIEVDDFLLEIHKWN